MTRHFDIFVIGGGINGCGIARDAVGRGRSVMLAEMNDLAQGTSSGSTKLIHGGLRYLEHFEFRLVRESLMERERLWAMAPQIIWPMRFVLPHHKGLRPAWMLRLGLFMYDHLGGRRLLPSTRTLNLRTDPLGAPLSDTFTKGFEYSDCWVDDARLVVLNARDAADRGAVVRTRTRVMSARVAQGKWQVQMLDQRTGVEEIVTADVLINAAGPWVDDVIGGVVGRNNAHNVRLVQGSHIVVPRLFDHDRSYIFQNADGRVVFAIPYEGDYTLIGTTDRDFDGDPADIRISDEERAYLTEAVSAYFRKPVTVDDIVWTYSAVRPLYDDGASRAQEATRDYVLTSDTDAGAPLINVFGGKITTFRRLAEEVMEKIDTVTGRKSTPWTARSTLPGGDMPTTGFDDFATALQAEFPAVDGATVTRLARLYGTVARDILTSSQDEGGLGAHFGAGIHAAELHHLIRREWVTEVDDVLYRRTKLGLRLTDAEKQGLSDWIRNEVAPARS
ncbi:MAG: glycerol-3-phosphate dehydrogenase [Minwuia sp.]|nr:glycerol-3-phosphate dehydrogenase [Minwuia sp.]